MQKRAQGEDELAPLVLRKDDQTPDGRRSSWYLALSGTLASSSIPWFTALVAGLCWIAVQGDAATDKARLLGRLAISAMTLATVCAVVLKERPTRGHLALALVALLGGAAFFVLLWPRPPLWDLRLMSIGSDHSAYVVTGQGETGSEVEISIGPDCDPRYVLERATFSQGRFMALVDNAWVHPNMELSIRHVPAMQGRVKSICRKLAAIPGRDSNGALSDVVVPGAQVEIASAFAGRPER